MSWLSYSDCAQSLGCHIDLSSSACGDVILMFSKQCCMDVQLYTLNWQLTVICSFIKKNSNKKTTHNNLNHPFFWICKKKQYNYKDIFSFIVHSSYIKGRRSMLNPNLHIAWTPKRESVLRWILHQPFNICLEANKHMPSSHTHLMNC